MRLLSCSWKQVLNGAGFLAGLLLIVFLLGKAVPDAAAQTSYSGALPSVLSSKDVSLYRQIFSLVEDGEWDAVEAKLAEVDDDLLKGSLLAQRYLVTYGEIDPKVLIDWLQNYGDTPEAEAIYLLAKARLGDSSLNIPSPLIGETLPDRGIAIKDGGANWGGGGYHSTVAQQKEKAAARGKKAATSKKKGRSVKAGKLDKKGAPAATKIAATKATPSAKASKAVKAKKPRTGKAVRAAGTKGRAAPSSSKGGSGLSPFWTALRQNDPDRAALLLEASQGKSATLSPEMADMKIALSAYYLTHGRTGDAARISGEIITQSTTPPPNAYWVAGLAEWRQGNHEQASRHFEAIAGGGKASGWLTSASAYWAARADLVARHPERVNAWLETAAAYPRTFYGIMARRALARSGDNAWENSVLAGLDVELLSATPGTRRALALIQIGKTDKAAAELALLFPHASPELGRSIQALAFAGNMPELAKRFGSALLSREDSSVDVSNYPLPNWQPDGGWALDKALVYAFVRQESAFNVTARSAVGAAGVMQLMPATARIVAGEKVDRKTLHDPESNMELGQKYLNHLLDDPIVEGNLFYLAAAYNGGPGAVQRWKANGVTDDPLYFIETIPARETRVFVQRVMTNLWIYRDRMGQTAPSLDAVVDGKWPHYVAQDLTHQGGRRADR